MTPESLCKARVGGRRAGSQIRFLGESFPVNLGPASEGDRSTSTMPLLPSSLSFLAVAMSAVFLSSSFTDAADADADVAAECSTLEDPSASSIEDGTRTLVAKNLSFSMNISLAGVKRSYDPKNALDGDINTEFSSK